MPGEIDHLLTFPASSREARVVDFCTIRGRRQAVQLCETSSQNVITPCSAVVQCNLLHAMAVV